MDQPRHAFPDLESFVTAITRAGVRGVGVRWVREIRPRHLEGHKVEVGSQQWVDLTGYAKGELFVARLPGADGVAIEARLKALGIAVKSDSGNIT